MTGLVTLTEAEHHCLLQIDDGKANAISFELLEQLGEALPRAAEAGKVLVVMGRPGKFSAGFDLNVMRGGEEGMRKLLLGGARLSRKLLDFPTPVILGVSGHALAMGALLLLSADYRIGVRGDFKIGLNEVAIGMTLPYFGIELARARLDPAHFELSVSCAYLYDAVGAVEAGYLDESVGADQTMSRARQVATQLSGLNMDAHKATKDRVREPLNQAMEEAVAKELGG